MKLYISSAFSLSMLDREKQKGTPCGCVPVASDAIGTARVPRPVNNPRDMVRSWLDNGAEIISVLGHASTQALMEETLGIEVPVNRVSIKLTNQNERVLVGQYTGPRLLEGATELLEGATLEWWII